MRIRKKLLFVIPYLGGGGAERVMLTLLNNLSREKYDLYLCLIKEKGNYFSELNKDVKVHLLNCSSFALSFCKIYRCIKGEKPDIVIGFLSFVIVYLGILKRLFFPKTIFIARETGLPSTRGKKLAINQKMFCTFAYGSMDAIISQCNYQKKELISYYRISPKKIKPLPNPTNCDVAAYDHKPRSGEIINLVSAGSLNERKNYHSAIEAMSLCQDRKIILHIYGQGPLWEELTNQIRILNLENNVILHGFKHDLKRYYSQYDAYLMTSQFEPCSNALLEAQACGLPAIVYDCPGANSEIIIEGKTGFLVELNNIAMLAKTILEKEYLHMDRKFIHNHIERLYSIDSSITQYEEFFDKFVK